MAGLGMDLSDETQSQAVRWSSPSQADGAALDLTAAIMDFISGLAGQTMLVAIDDLHLVDSSPAVVTRSNSSHGDCLRDGPCCCPPGGHFPSSSTEWPLGGRLVRLRGRELRLTPNEVAAWVAQNWGLQLQASDARALWRLTQGWPAALVLLGQRLLSDGSAVSRRDVAGIIARGGDLRTYLERDILSGLDESAAKVMLAAALLPR